MAIWGSVAQKPLAERERCPAHRHFIITLRCIVCGAEPPSDPHHLKFMQPRAMALKSGDQWCVPMCRKHHDALENAGDEIAWWARHDMDPVPLALELWRISRQVRGKQKPPPP